MSTLSPSDVSKIAAAYQASERRMVQTVRANILASQPVADSYGTGAWEFDLDAAILANFMAQISVEVLS